MFWLRFFFFGYACSAFIDASIVSIDVLHHADRLCHSYCLWDVVIYVTDYQNDYVLAFNQL